MRANLEIAKNIRISNMCSVFATCGAATVTLPSGFCGSVIWSSDEDGWEHVSVSSYRRSRMPSWADMCEVKDIFFDDEEEAVQVHPRASEYVHGVGPRANRLENVLHLWRPKNGDWGLMNK